MQRLLRTLADSRTCTVTCTLAHESARLVTEAWLAPIQVALRSILPGPHLCQLGQSSVAPTQLRGALQRTQQRLQLTHRHQPCGDSLPQLQRHSWHRPGPGCPQPDQASESTLPATTSGRANSFEDCAPAPGCQAQAQPSLHAPDLKRRPGSRVQPSRRQASRSHLRSRMSASTGRFASSTCSRSPRFTDAAGAADNRSAYASRWSRAGMAYVRGRSARGREGRTRSGAVCQAA